jgi:hypothetical protein
MVTSSGFHAVNARSGRGWRLIVCLVDPNPYP